MVLDYFKMIIMSFAWRNCVANKTFIIDPVTEIQTKDLTYRIQIKSANYFIDCGLPACDIVWSCTRLLTCRRNIPPPSSAHNPEDCNLGLYLHRHENLRSPLTTPSLLVSKLTTLCFLSCDVKRSRNCPDV
jgi:hypothetical protein